VRRKQPKIRDAEILLKFTQFRVFMLRTFGFWCHAVLYEDVDILGECAASILDQPSIWGQVFPKWCYVPMAQTASNNLTDVVTLWLEFRKCQDSCQSLTNLTESFVVSLYLQQMSRWFLQINLDWVFLNL
jgi:hypothetical protein